jgi:predicted DsbA family dithiol-disulfide isomerase
METLKLTVYSDYVCPWCYVGQGAVEKLTQAYAVELTWRPFYLRPDTPPEGTELPANVKAHMAETNEHLKQLANAAGLEMVLPDRIPNTRIAHEATEYANQKGKGLEFHRAVFDRYYGRGEDVSQWMVLRAVALEVGLDADEMQREVESGKFTQIVNDQVNEAVQIGIDCVPTYILNDRYEIVGAQPYEKFAGAVEQIEKETGIRYQKKG